MALNRIEPLFAQVLGADWDRLAPVLRRHYFMRPFSADEICVTGIMSKVDHSWLAKLFMPAGLLLGALVPYRGRNVPIEVLYNADESAPSLYWKRVFHFPQRDFIFRSRMLPDGDNHVIEYVRFGVGVRLVVTAEQGGLIFRNSGYVWKLGSLKLPLPIGFMLGKVYVEEMPVSENEFRMRMTLTHGLFGRLFEYTGEFTLP